MASHLADNLLHGSDHPDTHASGNRWRHQESSSFSKHAAPRAPNERHGSHDLANFLNSTRVESQPRTSGSGSGPTHQPINVTENAHGTQEGITGRNTTGRYGVLEVKCGPLLNYRRMEEHTWFGSVLIVTKGGGLYERDPPVLVLKPGVSAAAESVAYQPATNGSDEAENGENGVVNGVDYSSFQAPASSQGINDIAPTDGAQGYSSGGDIKIPGTKLYSDLNNTFWRFDLQVPMQETEIRCDYSIPGLRFPEGTKTDRQSFFIPAITDSMRIMFHSCNGFSVGTDEDAYSGPCLWNDVRRVHKKTPFHVMLGGGDQIYNDGIRVNGPLRSWTDIGIPKKRREHPFPEELRRKCDEYYVNNYIKWYSTEPFAGANGQIPQLNLWDDHDIIDGFGSYVDDFMRCPVFRGIGGVANKYYLLFQHHLAPPVSSFTTGEKPLTHSRPTSSAKGSQDAARATSADGRLDPDPRQLENTYVLQEKTIDSSYIIGSKPGPYVVDHSRSIYARLGARIAFFGIDARTERTRHQVNYPETYQIIFSRLRKELGEAKASSSPIQHLIVLLGIPIAYPRLTWLENIFSSPIMGPMKFLNKRFGFGGGFFNYFDGSVDLLDDLDDHYTARTHKKERLYLVQELQKLAAEFSVRISILGGDVHLAAVGRFYSNLKLGIPVEQDHRYMANIISSAIVNKPPPQAVANLLARRNRIHHLDPDTDETLMKFFDKDPGKSNKTSRSNHVTMPSRNWAMITENYGPNGSGLNGQINGYAPNSAAHENPSIEELPKAKDGHSWLHKGEQGAGTKHKAADSEQHGKDTDGSLDVCIRVEMDQHDKEGKTQPYGMNIPKLVHDGNVDAHVRKRDAIQGAFNEKHPAAKSG